MRIAHLTTVLKFGFKFVGRNGSSHGCGSTAKEGRACRAGALSCPARRAPRLHSPASVRESGLTCKSELQVAWWQWEWPVLLSPCFCRLQDVAETDFQPLTA